MSAEVEKFKQLYRDGRHQDLLALLEELLAGAPSDAELLTWAARSALAAKTPQLAESYASRALESNPTRRDASQHLCKALLAQEQWAGARSAAEAVLATEPANPIFHSFAGRACFGAGEYETALEYLRKALEASTRDPQALKLAGESALRTGDFGFAVEAFAKLAESDVQSALSAAQVLRERRQTEAAASILQAVLRHHPENERVKSRASALVSELVLRANLALQSSGELESAKFHAIALRLDPGARAPLRAIQKYQRDMRRSAREAMTIGESGRALELLGILLAVTPDDPQTLFDIAQIKHKFGHPDKAGAWQAAAKAGGYEDARLLTIADRLTGLGHAAEAAAAVGRLSPAAAMDGNAQRIRAKVIVGLQHSLTKAARAAESENLQNLLNALSEIDPQNPAFARFRPKAVTLRARDLREARLAGNAEAVERHARALLELDPNNTAAMHYLTNSYTRRGKWREALPVARALAAHTGGDPQARRNFARICYSAREREEGLAVCEAGLAADPEDGQLLSLREKLASLPLTAAAK